MEYSKKEHLMAQIISFGFDDALTQALIDGFSKSTEEEIRDDLENLAEAAIWLRKFMEPDTKIFDFYTGKGTDAKGRSLLDILAFTDDQFEYVHDFIQWLFPLPEPSRAQPQSPILTEKELELMKSDPLIKNRVEVSLLRYTNFLAHTKAWRRDFDHNHLRITRALRFLTLMGMDEHAKGLFKFAVDGSKPSSKTKWYWEQAMTLEPEWIK